MSIEAKHAYRFGFLRSARWDQIRLETLVAQKSKCYICGEEKWNNDVHHVIYPKDWNRPTINRQLLVLCRACHEITHKLIQGKILDRKSKRWGFIRRTKRVLRASLTESIKEEESESEIEVPICRCCGIHEVIAYTNVFWEIQRDWVIGLCAGCHPDVVNFVAHNAETMKGRQHEPFAVVKRFFKEKRLKYQLT